MRELAEAGRPQDLEEALKSSRESIKAHTRVRLCTAADAVTNGRNGPVLRGVRPCFSVIRNTATDAAAMESTVTLSAPVKYVQGGSLSGRR
jgi:hypothetical protein